MEKIPTLPYMVSVYLTLWRLVMVAATNTIHGNHVQLTSDNNEGTFFQEEIGEVKEENKQS